MGTRSGRGGHGLSRACMEARHLVVLQHGLWASPGILRALVGHLRGALPGCFCFLAARSNSRALSVTGIRRCGERLAEEVTSEVQKHPGVQRISFVGHSFGGVICRRAIHLGLNEKGKIFGLEPGIFATVASPHLGVAMKPEGGLEVPLVEWLGEPLHPLGAGLVRAVGRAIGVTVHGLTGWDLMQSLEPTTGWEEVGGGREGLELLEMVNDAHLAALRAFSHRVLYSAAGTDHMVPLLSSSLRSESTVLKVLGAYAAKNGKPTPGNLLIETVPSEDCRDDGGGPGSAAAVCLGRLRTLDWTRVDCPLGGPALLAHRGLLNPRSAGGLALADHLAGVLGA